MIDIRSKHDNMHKNEIFYASICINNHIISCVNCMLSEAYSNSGYASDCGDWKSIFNYCILVSGNLVTWQSQKLHITSLSSVKAEYHAMMHASFEML